VICSLDPVTMVETLYSTPPPGSNHYYNSININNTCRREAIGLLLLSALPALVASILLWAYKNVSSAGILVYASASFVVGSIVYSINGNVWDDHISKWWFTLSGFVYVVVLVYFHLMGVSRNVDENHPSIRYGINIGGLAFIYGICSLILEKFDTLWGWTLVTGIAFVPVTFLGVATDITFLMVLGAVGLMADAERLAIYLSNDGNAVLIQFVVLVLSGLGIGAIGVALTRNQDRIRAKVRSSLSCPPEDACVHVELSSMIDH
jgi:hypothetical protein